MPIIYSSSSNFSVGHVFDSCQTINDAIIISAFIITKSVFIVPLAILVLYQGYQRWRQQCSFKNTSHSDIFTYQQTVMQLFGVSGGALYLCGFAFPYVITVAFCTVPSFICGEIMFHVLTCVERYLAVVHPITYIGLKNAGCVRIRNICIGCVWLFSFGWVGTMFLYAPKTPVVLFFCFLTSCFIVVSFCSISVLFILIRPGPGEMGGDKKRVDQSKKRAFHTMMVITGALWLMFIGDIICTALTAFTVQSFYVCSLLSPGLWMTLPSSLVLPLLFLHRAGKQTC